MPACLDCSKEQKYFVCDACFRMQCDTCGKPVLETEECPNNKGTCNDCCLVWLPDGGCGH